jgi:hypothetical protein
VDGIIVSSTWRNVGMEDLEQYVVEWEKIGGLFWGASMRIK